MDEWKKDREYQLSIYTEVHATLRNIALGKGFMPPSGECWTSAMFRADYRPPAKPDEDWKAQQKLLMRAFVAKPIPTREEAIRKNEQAAEHAHRVRRATEAAQRGISGEQIQLIMTGRL